MTLRTGAPASGMRALQRGRGPKRPMPAGYDGQGPAGVGGRTAPLPTSLHARHIVLLLILSSCEPGREDHRADAALNPRQDGTSHKVYKTPWQGDPRVNIQRGKNGNAKAYQVRQVLDAIARLEAEKNEESDDDA
jgi:hypothetical protein